MEDSTIYVKTDKGEVIQIPPIDKLCEMLKIKFNKQQMCLNHYTEAYRKSKLEVYKTEELSRLKKELAIIQKQLQNGFPITEEENKRIKEWVQNHEHNKTIKSYSFIFTPTPIGTDAIVRCNCGKEFRFREL